MFSKFPERFANLQARPVSTAPLDGLPMGFKPSPVELIVVEHLPVPGLIAPQTSSEPMNIMKFGWGADQLMTGTGVVVAEPNPV